MANLLKRLWTEEDGQGLVEYTLVVLLVALFFWLGVRRPELALASPTIGLKYWIA